MLLEPLRQPIALVHVTSPPRCFVKRDDETKPSDVTAVGGTKEVAQWLRGLSPEFYPRGEAAIESSLSSRRRIDDPAAALPCPVHGHSRCLDSRYRPAFDQEGSRLHPAEPPVLRWVINGYILTYGGFLLLGGRAADLLGRRRMLVTGLIVFAGASLAGGLAQTESMLIAARLSRSGLRAAMLSPAALSTLTTTFRSDSDRHKALGMWAAVLGLAGAIGVLFGGLLTEGPGWRWVLFVNVPLSAVALAGAFLLLAGERRKQLVDVDARGAFLVTFGNAAPRLHAGEGAGRGLGGRSGQSPDWRSRWPSSPHSWSTSCESGIRSCRCRSCGSRALPSPTRRRWWRWPDSSRCSSS